MGQLRIIIPAIGTIVSAVGIVKPDAVGSAVAGLMTAVGPIAYVIVVAWSFMANSRRSILTSAAKPAEPGLAAPQIVLPKEEAALAQQLPSNVNTTNDVKVVPK
jgi:hypothetical protein